jgi:hypothetical protein
LIYAGWVFDSVIAIRVAACAEFFRVSAHWRALTIVEEDVSPIQASQIESCGRVALGGGRRLAGKRKHRVADKRGYRWLVFGI